MKDFRHASALDLLGYLLDELEEAGLYVNEEVVARYEEICMEDVLKNPAVEEWDEDSPF